MELFERNKNHTFFRWILELSKEYDGTLNCQADPSAQVATGTAYRKQFAHNRSPTAEEIAQQAKLNKNVTTKGADGVASSR